MNFYINIEYPWNNALKEFLTCPNSKGCRGKRDFLDSPFRTRISALSTIQEHCSSLKNKALWIHHLKVFLHYWWCNNDCSTKSNRFRANLKVSAEKCVWMSVRYHIGNGQMDIRKHSMFLKSSRPDKMLILYEKYIIQFISDSFNVYIYLLSGFELVTSNNRRSYPTYIWSQKVYLYLGPNPGKRRSWWYFGNNFTSTKWRNKLSK